MPVINPSVLPARQPNAPGWWETFGTTGLNTATDLLLKAIFSSQLGQVPTGTGTLQLPGGGAATPGPGLQSQLTAGQLPQLIQQGQFQPGTTYQPQTRIGFKPNVDYLSKQADIAYKQAQTKSLTPEFQADQYRRLLGLPPLGTETPTADNEFLRGLSDLSAKAQAGDEDAVSRIRMIRKLMQGT